MLARGRDFGEASAFVSLNLGKLDLPQKNLGHFAGAMATFDSAQMTATLKELMWACDDDETVIFQQDPAAIGKDAIP